MTETVVISEVLSSFKHQTVVISGFLSSFKHETEVIGEFILKSGRNRFIVFVRVGVDFLEVEMRN